MAGQFDDDFLAQLIELVGFRPYLVSPAVPEYVQNEILEEETPSGIGLYDRFTVRPGRFETVIIIPFFLFLTSFLRLLINFLYVRLQCPSDMTNLLHFKMPYLVLLIIYYFAGNYVVSFLLCFVLLYFIILFGSKLSQKHL